MPGVSNMSRNIQVQRSTSPQTNSTTSTRTFSSYSTNTFGTDNQAAGELFIRPVQNATNTNTQTSTTTKSSGLFSNHHADKQSVPVNNSNVKTSSTSVRSSSLVRNALNNIEDGSEVRNSQAVVVATPTWLNDGQNVPISYEIVTKPDGKKEFQLRLDAKSFNPEDLNVKVENDNLVIEGNHEDKSASGCISVKSFTRRCNIPPGVKPEDLNCSLDTSGRLMITAPVNEAPPAVNTITTKTITYEPIGFHVAPGPREQIITVYQDSGPVGRSTSTTTSSKTVRTFKTLS